MVKELDFSKKLGKDGNETNQKEEDFGKDFHKDLSVVLRNLAEYVSISSAEGKFEGGTLSKDTFKYLSALNLVILVADAMERNVFEDVKDMQSRVNMFLSAMRTCFDVETTEMVISENEES